MAVGSGGRVLVGSGGEGVAVGAGTFSADASVGVTGTGVLVTKTVTTTVANRVTSPLSAVPAGTLVAVAGTSVGVGDGFAAESAGTFWL
ncbi:MAG: hypothetical protein P8183_23625 [Anaerolineae bacterium]